MDYTSLLDLLNDIFGTSVTQSDGFIYIIYLVFGFILFLFLIKLVLTLILSLFGINRRL